MLYSKSLFEKTKDKEKEKMLLDTGQPFMNRVGIMKQGRLVAIRKRRDFKHADLEEIYMCEMQAAAETVS